MFKNFFTLTKNRNSLSILLSLLILLIIFILSISGIFYIFDKKIGDIYYKLNSDKINIDKNIIVVEIDEDTLSGRFNNGKLITKGLGRFPFDRSHYATVIDNLINSKVAVIGLDIIFGEESDIKSDDKLAKSIKNAKNIVLGSWFKENGDIQNPYEKFNKGALTVGFLLPNVDKSTGVTYSIFPFFKSPINNKIIDYFSIAVLKGFFSKIYLDEGYLKNDYKFFKNKIEIGNKINLVRSRQNSDEILINYTNQNRFFKVSFLDIYNNNFNKKDFKDKIIIIGATAKGIKDVFNSPLGVEYGVYTHVNMLNTILGNNYIRYLEKNLEWFLIFLLIIVSVYFNISRSSYILVLSNIALISFFFIGVFYITIITNYLLNFPVEFGLALILSLVISNIVKYLIENKNKAKLNKALSEYVSIDVANEILSGEGKINLDGENKNIAIFFSDIEGFTSISEKFSPEELVGFLREYLSEMSNIILDEKGFINKYEGDAIMALWGVFGEDSKKTYRACLSALEQQNKLKELNKIWSLRGFSEIKARIGIHNGNAIIGNIGSEGRKMEFTALGDSVNLASRLEGVNKFYSTYICVSEDIYNIEKGNFEFRYLDNIKVKGKDNSINIYELLGKKGNLTNEEINIYNIFEEAIDLYRSMKFEKALKSFIKLSKLGDAPSKTYIERCTEYIKNDPGEGWDGIWKMINK